jgi:uncharacterized protein
LKKKLNRQKTLADAKKNAQLEILSALALVPGVLRRLGGSISFSLFTRMILRIYFTRVLLGMDSDKTFTAFAGERVVGSGALADMLRDTKLHLERHPDAALLIFVDQSGQQVEFDFRGSLEQVLARETPPAPGPGRPKLGVVSREVSLLPRHWEWLEQQPNGISAALRRVVDEASKRDPDAQRARRARDAASRVMTALAGNRPGFEEASRALFAGDHARLQALTRRWPIDLRRHLARLLALPAP